MKIDYSKLKGRIVEKYGTQKNFSLDFGKSERTVSLKLQNKIPFDSDEIMLTLELLGIPKDETDQYFFTERV